MALLKGLAGTKVHLFSLTFVNFFFNLRKKGRKTATGEFLRAFTIYERVLYSAAVHGKHCMALFTF